MSEMEERVAKAIALSGNGGSWDDWYNEDQREFHRKRARAAIRAMRKPTAEMRQAGDDVIPDNVGFKNDARATYVAMIDAALND